MKVGDMVKVTRVSGTDPLHEQLAIKGIHHRVGRLMRVDHRSGGWYRCKIKYLPPVRGRRILTFESVRLEKAE